MKLAIMDHLSTGTRQGLSRYEDKENILGNLHRFLGIDESDENDASLEERTKSAIVLLQCLPCARSAIFEQIGEVFHEVAKKYVIEVEKQMLSGQPDFPEVSMPELDSLVQNIQKILVTFVKCNCDAWAPQIARWSVNLVGELCSQYGVLRGFATLPIDERMQLWMNCEACRLLMEISVTCFAKIIEDKPDLCVEYMLETAAQCSPFFDWAIAHICCCFLDVVPYGILSHALQAFSMQAKHAETIINCVTRVYNYLLNQHGKVLQNAVLDLFKDSVAALTVEAGSEQEHIDKCTLPFLLHLALQAPQLVDIITEKVVDLLDLKTMAALNEQANKRDIILQRGLLSRVLDILKNIGSGTYKIIMFLVNGTCNKTFFSDGDPKILEERKRICGTILEMLLLSLHENLQNQSAIKNSDDLLMVTTHLQDDRSIESPFLKDLQKHTMDISNELLESTGIRATVLIRTLCISSLYGKEKTAVDTLAFLLLNSKSANNLIQTVAVQSELEVHIPDILEKSIDAFLGRICSTERPLKNAKIFNALNNCITLTQDDAIQNEQNRTRFRLHLKEKWALLSFLTTFENQDLSSKALELIDLLTLPSHQPLSDAFKASMNLTAAYFNCLLRIFRSDASEDSNWQTVLLCEKLLIGLVRENPNLQRSVLRNILETLLQKENITLVANGSSINNNDEDEILIKEPKIQLFERNNQPDVVSRIPVNRSSVIYAGSLNRNKRKMILQNNSETETKSALIQQCLLNTIDDILSLTINMNEKMDVDMSRASNFNEVQMSRIAESGGRSSYCFLATFMAELVCPDVVATLPWPDEEFLKYTVERDIKIKKQFEQNPFLWHIMSLISTERPSLCFCVVIVQSLLSSCLTYWEVDRKKTVAASPCQLKITCQTLQLIKEAGFVPEPWCNAADILRFLKPNEVYRLLSGIWRFCKELNLSPLKFSEKDEFGRPSIAFHPAQLGNLQQLYRELFLKNMASLGVHYKRFFKPVLKP